VCGETVEHEFGELWKDSRGVEGGGGGEEEEGMLWGCRGGKG
jgi:hypothetical protein